VDHKLREPGLELMAWKLRRKWGMKKNEEFRSLFILEMILEAKVSFVTKRGHVRGLEDYEERLLYELNEVETSFDVLDTPCDAAAKIAICRLPEPVNFSNARICCPRDIRTNMDIYIEEKFAVVKSVLFISSIILLIIGNKLPSLDLLDHPRSISSTGSCYKVEFCRTEF
ncbi:hypothetical protein Tco_0212957, partial [Tanacetum coccineum]